MHITVLPALRDNYIYLIRYGDRLAAVDPGESAPVLAALRAGGQVPEAIVITHAHYDHIGGVDDIRRAYPDIPVYAPAESGIAGAVPCAEGTQVTLFDNSDDRVTLTALDTPGHCAHHLCWHSGNVLFTGDSLFLGGCGRILAGGSEEQMFRTLTRLAQFPDDSKIYCGHEYTVANLTFAQAAEPDNPAIPKRLKTIEKALKTGQASVPATLNAEKQTNPFLRTDNDTVVKSAREHSGHDTSPGEQTFKILRHWKNNF